MKVMVADAHPLLREALKHLLNQLKVDVVVTEVGDMASALIALEAEPAVEIVLIDLKLAGTRRKEALSELRRLAPSAALVVLSESEEVCYVREAHERGAVGFIPKSTPIGVVTTALQLIISGGSYFPPGLLAPRVGEIERQTRRPGPGAETEYIRLTPRQHEVFAGLLSGKSSRQIAGELDISEGTVRVHLANIYRLLGVENRIQAVRRALELGLAGDFAARLADGE